MKRAFTSFFLLCALIALRAAAENYPTGTIINNRVCGPSPCPVRQALACFQPDPQYTAEAATAAIKGTVRLKVLIGTNGCAQEIRVLKPLGYGLDESAVFALQRWKFRKVSKATPVTIEINFDPKFSSPKPVVAPRCG